MLRDNCWEELIHCYSMDLHGRIIFLCQAILLELSVHLNSRPRSRNTDFGQSEPPLVTKITRKPQKKELQYSFPCQNILLEQSAHLRPRLCTRDTGFGQLELTLDQTKIPNDREEKKFQFSFRAVYRVFLKTSRKQLLLQSCCALTG